MTERRSWRFFDGALLAGLCALAVLAALPIWKDIYTVATRNDEQSHILLAPAVAAWLVWVRRERARLCRPRWTWAGPGVIALSWLLGRVSFDQGFLIGQHLSALGLVVGAALTVLGTGFLWKFFPAFVALLFLMPVPGKIRLEIAQPLMQWTAIITHHLMELFGQDITRGGNVLTINGVDVAVAEACNGMRMVAALGLVSYAFVFSIPMRNSVRVLILALSPVVALLCNVIRLVPTVIMFGHTDTLTAERFHDLSGWAVLVVALGFLWLILRLLRWMEVPIEPYSAAKA